MISKKEKAIIEIKEAIKYNCDSKGIAKHKGSNMLLLKEYARRFHLWQKALFASESDSEDSYPYNRIVNLDIASYIAKVKVDEDEAKEWIKESGMKANIFDRLAMVFYVNWKMHETEIFEKYGKVAPNPYEVFLVMFKRGAVKLMLQSGGFYFENYSSAIVQLSDSRKYDTVVPFINIYDEEALDEADRLFLEDPKNEIFL